MKSFIAVVLGLVVTCSVAFAQEDPPDALIKKVTEDVLTIVRQDKDIQNGNSKKAIELVEAKVLPNFNFQRMTALAVGQNLGLNQFSRRNVCPRRSERFLCAPIPMP